MKNLLAASLFFLTTCTGSKENAFPANDSLSNENNLIEDQHEVIHEYLKDFPNGTQVSIVLIQHNTSYFFGVERQNDTLISIDNASAVFEIGSISKVFTSTLFAGYVVEEQLEIDEKINDHLDVDLNNNLEFTFVELSNHTSGLPRMPSNIFWSSIFNMSNPYKNYDEEKLETYLTEKMELQYSPGVKSNYSNLGSGLLGYTLSKYSGEDYQTMAEERIFKKYGMNQTTTIRDEIAADLVPGRDEDGDITSNWDLAAFVGAGGILSSASDLTRFAEAQFDSTNRELALTRKISFVDSAGTKMGLGWHIIDNEPGRFWYFHNGGTGGYTSSMALSTLNRNGVIILSNVSSYHDLSYKIDRLCFSLLQSIDEKDFERITNFAREYTEAWNSNDPDNMASFFAEDGSLTINKGTPARGRAALSATADAFMQAFPDLHLSMDSLVADSDSYLYYWTFKGTNSGPGGTGNPVEFSGFEQWTINEDGLIQRSIGTFDADDYNRQLSGAETD